MLLLHVGLLFTTSKCPALASVGSYLCHHTVSLVTSSHHQQEGTLCLRSTPSNQPHLPRNGLFVAHRPACCPLRNRHRSLRGGKAPCLSGAGTLRRSGIPSSQARSLRLRLRGAEGRSSARCRILGASHRMSPSPHHCYSLATHECEIHTFIFLKA